MIQPVKGTRDFYPEEKRLQNYIFEVWRNVAVKFGYEEMDGPVLEPIELWGKKNGDELSEQLYTFTDKAGRSNVLRPEMTPTVARMVAAKKDLPKPIKWFSIQRFFRYEAPQKGRTREFWQLNMDCLGVRNPLADAELIASTIEVLKAFGGTAKDFYVRVGSRALMDALLKDMGVKQSSQVFRVMDKKDKVSAKEFTGMLEALRLPAQALVSIPELLNTKKLSQITVQSEQASQALAYLQEVLTIVKNLGYGSFVQVDLSITRGLFYYTDIVFEAFDKKGTLRALAGGGRYDNLVGAYATEQVPGSGYAMGDLTLTLWLTQLGKLPKTSTAVDYFIAVADDASGAQALQIATTLRKKYNVEVNVSNRSLGKQFQYADSKQIQNVIVVGQKDLLRGEVTVKNLRSGKQKAIKLSQISKL